MLGTVKQGPQGRQDASTRPEAAPLLIAETGSPALILAAFCPFVSCGSSLEFPKGQPEPRIGGQWQNVSAQWRACPRVQKAAEVPYGAGGWRGVIGQVRPPHLGSLMGKLQIPIRGLSRRARDPEAHGGRSPVPRVPFADLPAGPRSRPALPRSQA